jgi:hypothetical protein
VETHVALTALGTPERLLTNALLRCLLRRLSSPSQGKAEEWKRVWGLKPSMAIELYLQLAALMKVGGAALVVVCGVSATGSTHALWFLSCAPAPGSTHEGGERWCFYVVCCILYRSRH